MSAQSIIWNRNYFPPFCPLHMDSLPSLLDEYKDQSVVKQMYMIFFFYQLNFQQFQAILGDNKDVRDGKFYPLLLLKD